MIIANRILVGGNDEHGNNPPTPGKRTPTLPYINRPFYENEFNRPAKYLFLAACARNGFNTADLHPETADTPVTDRVALANRLRLDALVTFAYNATAEAGWNPVGGTLTFYSAQSPSATASRRLATDISNAVAGLGIIRNLGTGSLDVGVLSSVYMPAALLEAGFMTNFFEAKLMLDPDWQAMNAETTALGVCRFFDVPYTPPTLGTDYPTLRVGDRNLYVSLLQLQLAALGYPSGLYDGIFGGLTERNVRRFQADNGLTPDGVVGPETWRRLLTDYSVSPSLSLGSRGVFVRYLQMKLTSKLYYVGTVDSYFGDLTREAVESFQSEKGLPVTGIVDRRTWNEISVFDAGRELPG